MIKRFHSRFFWNSFLLVCLILTVVFLTAGIALVRFVDRSIKSTLDETLHYADAEPDRQGSGSKTDPADRPEAGGEREQTVGGTRFPSYLFRIRQEHPDPNATELGEQDEVRMLRGDYAYFDERESWRTLIDEMLKSERTINRISAESLCYEVDRSDTGISIAVIDYSGYRSLLVRLEFSVAAGVIALAGAFLLAMHLMSKRILEPVERAWENQERFVGDASHEIKTPLAIILSTAELSASDDPAENERRFSVIRDESRRINLLVSRMLESARIKNKAAQHRNDTVFSLSDAVTECALRYEALLYEHGVNMTADVEDGLSVRADENVLKQVLCALLDNAMKYTPQEKTAAICAHRKRRDAEITMRSEGVGVKESERAVIFERFYRGDEGRAHVEGSYGLGLAIAKNLIETMGGSIRCESDGETYTSFIITMRLARPPRTSKTA